MTIQLHRSRSYRMLLDAIRQLESEHGRSTEHEKIIADLKALVGPVEEEQISPGKRAALEHAAEAQPDEAKAEDKPRLGSKQEWANAANEAVERITQTAA